MVSRRFRAEGSLIQSSAERRPLARVLLTVLGGLAMIIGVFLPWRAATGQSGVDLNADSFMQVFNFSLDLSGFEQLISVGLAILALAALMIFRADRTLWPTAADCLRCWPRCW